MAAILPKVPADILNGVASDAAPRLATVTAADSPAPLVYGRQTVGAYIFAVGQIGGDLVLGCGWCPGEIEAVESILINGQAPDASVTVTHYTGTTSQTADATLAAAISGYADTLVATVNGIDIGAAYSVLRIPQAAVSGFPRIEAVIQGMKIYDPRENRLIYSEDFTHWTGSAVITAGVGTILNGEINLSQIADNNAASYLECSSNIYACGLNEIIFGSIYVEKDGITAATRFPLMRLTFTGTTARIADFSLDTSTGQLIWHGSTTNVINYDYGVIDCGDCWRPYIIVSCAEPGLTGVRFDIFPAVGANANITTYSVTATGSINAGGAQIVSANSVASYAKSGAAALTPITQYTANPALAIRDFATSALYGPGLTLDNNGVIDVAEACDAPLSDASKRREIGLTMDTMAPCAQWLDALRTYAGCFLLRNGVGLKLVPDRPSASVASLTDADVISRALKLAERAVGQRPTVVRVMYTDTSTYPWRTAPAIAYAAGVVAGTTPRREETVQLPGITRYAQAYREAVERLNAGTLVDLDVEFETFDEALAYEEGDVIDLTHSIGLSAKELRILAKDRIGRGRYKITAAEYADAVYSDDVAANIPNNSALPSPSSIAAPTGLTCASGSAQLLALADGTIISRILVTVDDSTDIYFRALEVDYQKSGDSSAGHAADAYDGGAYCSPVEDGATYTISARFRNSFGVHSAWTTTSHVVVGKSEAPPPAEAFLVSRDSDGTRRFTWNPPSTPPVDLDGARISYGLGTGLTIGSMAAMHEGLLYSSPYETNALAAGTYTFGIEYFDTSGNASTAVYIEVTIGDPRLAGAILIQQSHLDGWPGTQTNCFVDSTSGWLLAHDNKTWGDLTTDAVTWATWSQFTRDPKTLTYTADIVDAGVVTTFTPLLSAEYAGTPTLEIRTSDDNVTWTGWAAPAGQVTTRYVQARATIAPIGTALTALKTMTLILDAAPITEDINDLYTSTLTGSHRIGVGDIRLPITKTYGAINNVFLALQNVGAGWTWEVIDKDVSVGPRIKLYNGSGTLADAVIDANVRGV